MIVRVDGTVKASVFNRVYLPYLTCERPTQIYFGGSSSGKSVFGAQRRVMDVFNGGRNYLCIRNVKATIKTSIFNETVKVIRRFGLQEYFTVGQSELIITCKNGYQLLFAGLDDVEKVKSITPQKGVITDIDVEEATEIQPNDIRQLNKRLRGKSKYPKRVSLFFNPIMQTSWLYSEYFKHWDDSKTAYQDEQLSILKTTYKDNIRFLDQGDIDRLENETDKYYYDVYTLGNWGVLGNLIFKNWEMRDLHNEFVEIQGKQVCIIDTFDNIKNGLDFGFSQDPSAMPHTHYDKKRQTIYVFGEIYEREMTNDILAKAILDMIQQQYITCDSAEPKSIKELQQLGVRALTAKKGPDSVNFGIDWLQRQKIVVDLKCQNFKNEIQQYKWKEDRDGNVLKVPVDKNNHLLDALRYSYEDEAMGRVMTVVRGFM